MIAITTLEKAAYLSVSRVAASPALWVVLYKLGHINIVRIRACISIRVRRAHILMMLFYTDAFCLTHGMGRCPNTGNILSA